MAAISDAERSSATCSEITVPDVSVIIPAFNASDTLPAAIESVLRQRGVKTEIIVVDDSSTDATDCVLEFYSDFVQSVRIPNSGPATARNSGSLLARGRWIAFLDADDQWEPGKLNSQLQMASATNCRIVYTNARNVGDDLPVDEIRLPYCPTGDVYHKLLNDNFVTLSGLMLERRLFLDVGCFDENIIGCEDWDLLLRLAEHHHFAAVDLPLVRYLWRDHSLSSDHKRMLTARLATISKALQTKRGSTIPRSECRRIWANLWQTSAWTASFTSKLAARICAIRSFLCRPNWKALKTLLKP